MRRLLRWLLGGLAALVIIFVVTYALLVSIAQPAPEHPFFTAGPDVLVIAHQGGDGLRPSNTMASFTHAMELGVDVLEMDIHSTADGVLVTIHDDTVDRTTDGTGAVLDFTFEELSALDAGYHWPTLAEEADRTDRPYRGQGVTIPALTEIFEAFPDVRMNIEIKQREPSIAAQLCDLLRQYDMTDRALVASFHQQSIDEFRQACPEVPTSSPEGEIRVFYALNVLTLTPAYGAVSHAFQVPEYGGGLQVITPGFVRAAQGRNVHVHAWTINTEEDMRRILDAGVNGIITDYPDRLLSLLGR